MTDVASSIRRFELPSAGTVYKSAYRMVAYFGLLSVFGSQIYGFRYDPLAPAGNWWFDILLYAGFLVPHLIMSRAWFKRAFWGNPAGLPRERRFYIGVTLATWFAVLILHRPVAGPALSLPPVVPFIGIVMFLLCVLLFFQGITFSMIDGLVGVPGTVSAYSHGAETPLFTEGPYAEVRHPMYRAATLGALSSLFIHPHVAQLLWTSMIVGTFLAFIPVEERQLIAARGDAYGDYKRRTPYRLFRGIW